MKSRFIFTGSLALALFIAPVAAHARAFRSDLTLKVYRNGGGPESERFLGTTGSRHPKGVDVPGDEFWYVRPVGKLSDDVLIDLAREVRQKRIPGLDLSERWDVRDDTLAPFEGIRTLRFLLLQRTKITNAGLQHLEGMTGLRYLAVNSLTNDAGVASLAPLKGLVGLELRGTRITDAALATVADHFSLTTLDLSDTKITDNGIVRLVQPGAGNESGLVKQLRDLDLSGTRVATKGLVALAEATRLEELDLNRTATGDASMPTLADITTLRVLELKNTRVTAKGLRDLAQLPRLESISVPWNDIDRDHLRAIARLPHLREVWLNNNRFIAAPTLQKIRTVALRESRNL